MSRKLNKKQRERLRVFNGQCDILKKRIRNRWGYSCDDLTTEEVETILNVMAEVDGKPRDIIEAGEMTFLVFCGLWYTVHESKGHRQARAVRWLDQAREERSIDFLGPRRLAVLERIGVCWLRDRMKRRKEA